MRVENCRTVVFMQITITRENTGVWNFQLPHTKENLFKVNPLKGMPPKGGVYLFELWMEDGWKMKKMMTRS